MCHTVVVISNLWDTSRESALRPASKIICLYGCVNDPPPLKMPHRRDFFGGASCQPYPTPAPDRATVWLTGPAATAASTAVCRSAWRRAWAEMVRRRQTHYRHSFTALFIPGCSFIYSFVLLSCEVWSDVQTSAGLFNCWSGETPTAAAATAAAASGRRPARLVLLHQGPSGPLPAAPSAHGLSLHGGGRAAVLLHWCSPVPRVLPSWVAGVKYDLPRIGSLYCVKIPRKGGHQRTPWPKRLALITKQALPCVVPIILFGLRFIFPGNSGFEPRQPAHDLMASFHCSPLEDRYNLYPHSLRNMGEPTALRDKMDAVALPFWYKNKNVVLSFRWAVCQHRALPPRDEPVQSGGAAGAQVEAVQQRGDPVLPEQSKPARQLFCGSHTSIYSGCLITKHVIENGKRPRVLLVHQRGNWENLFLFLLLLWSDRASVWLVKSVRPPITAFQQHICRNIMINELNTDTW